MVPGESPGRNWSNTLLSGSPVFHETKAAPRASQQMEKVSRSE